MSSSFRSPPFWGNVTRVLFRRYRPKYALAAGIPTQLHSRCPLCAIAPFVRCGPVPGHAERRRHLGSTRGGCECPQAARYAGITTMTTFPAYAVHRAQARWVSRQPLPGRPCERGGRAMGRGRAKAKQTKVARELKYSSHPDRPRRACSANWAVRGTPQTPLRTIRTVARRRRVRPGRLGHASPPGITARSWPPRTQVSAGLVTSPRGAPSSRNSRLAPWAESPTSPALAARCVRRSSRSPRSHSLASAGSGDARHHADTEVECQLHCARSPQPVCAINVEDRLR